MVRCALSRLQMMVCTIAVAAHNARRRWVRPASVCDAYPHRPASVRRRGLWACACWRGEASAQGHAPSQRRWCLATNAAGRGHAPVPRPLPASPPYADPSRVEKDASVRIFGRSILLTSATSSMSM